MPLATYDPTPEVSYTDPPFGSGGDGSVPAAPAPAPAPLFPSGGSTPLASAALRRTADSNKPRAAHLFTIFCTFACCLSSMVRGRVYCHTWLRGLRSSYLFRILQFPKLREGCNQVIREATTVLVPHRALRAVRVVANCINYIGQAQPMLDASAAKGLLDCVHDMLVGSRALPREPDNFLDAARRNGRTLRRDPEGLIKLGLVFPLSHQQSQFARKRFVEVMRGGGGGRALALGGRQVLGLFGGVRGGSGSVVGRSWSVWGGSRGGVLNFRIYFSTGHSPALFSSPHSTQLPS